jgi:hypothetical protein
MYQSLTTKALSIQGLPIFGTASLTSLETLVLMALSLRPFLTLVEIRKSC